MKLLLIGPYPPPHGGISVHLAEAKRKLDETGICCRVLNLNRNAPESEQYIRSRTTWGLLLVLLRHSRCGWILHLHINGHNGRSWMLALFCGLVGQVAPRCLLTIHSGMAPIYLNQGRGWRRQLARASCLLYDRIITVNQAIRNAVISLGISPNSLEELPAYLSTAPLVAIPQQFEDLARDTEPLLTTVLFYRPEYGFDVLVHALAKLRSRHPKIRCLVMGSGEQQQDAELLVRKEGLEDIVRMLGDIPHELCLAIILLSDLFVRVTLQDGDSISVREALSLGVPVVASNVGTRPPGAFLFEAGNSDDLISQIEGALAMSSRNRDAPTGWLSPNHAYRLLEIYMKTGTKERSYERGIH